MTAATMNNLRHQLRDHIHGRTKSHTCIVNGKPAELPSEIEVHRTHSISSSAPSANFMDVTIQFISATGLPTMDPVGGADPYFKAKIDDMIDYVSTAQPSTLSPVWNEIWQVKNVPLGATLKVKVWDKDVGTFRDDYFGKFETSISESGLQEHPIVSLLGRTHGVFKLNIMPNPTVNPSLPPYTFAGPCRFSRHNSPTLGLFTVSSTEERLYSSWKIHLVGISLFFGDTYQEWNRHYPAAQTIFSGPLSVTVRTPIQAGHKLLYARTSANLTGIIHRSVDFLNLFRDESHGNRIKPTMYTYIINDDTLRFSETGAAFFVDFVSKHALHSNCAPRVRYSGEFHLRPPGGWRAWDEAYSDNSVEWELVLDNNSGTYAPDATMLPTLRSLIEYNFPGLKVVVLDHGDLQLKESVDACREYAKSHRGLKEGELSPKHHTNEVTLHHMASVKRKGKK